VLQSMPFKVLKSIHGEALPVHGYGFSGTSIA